MIVCFEATYIHILIKEHYKNAWYFLQGTFDLSRIKKQTIFKIKI